MKFIVDELPYFINDPCPFLQRGGGCACQNGAPCEHFDPPCRERNLDECAGLITYDAYMKQKGDGWTK